MRRPVALAFWAGVFGALGIFDYWCAKNTTVGDSLSECTRTILRTDTRRGALIFIGGWAALTAWLIPHICRRTHRPTADDNRRPLGCR